MQEVISRLIYLKPELELVSTVTLPRQEKKTRRLIDERKYYDEQHILRRLF